MRDEDPCPVPRAGAGEAGAGRSARTRQAQTVAERLRREGAWVHEDSRFDIGPARPLADLRHVMCECVGTEGRPGRVEGLVLALDGMLAAVPRRGDTQAYHQLTRAARAALEASDQATLTDAQWAHVDDVLAAFVPDFARAGSTEAERAGLVKAVVEAITLVHRRAADLVRVWQRTHRRELDRRRDQERFRGLLRVVVRAWREVADGRGARSLRVAVPTGVLVEAGRHAARLDTDALPTAHSSVRPRRDESEADCVARERKCEGGSGLLPVARSAVPAGSLARLLMTHARLVEGGRLRRRRRECVRAASVRKGKAEPAGRPAEEDWRAKVRRVRALEEAEGLVVPVAQGGSARGGRRRRLSR